ncbi:MAG: Gfo/Idh/MocA family oxidoreductase [Candidatus Brocadiia bacterium]|nr:MAG: Gfo/Idh/MocA family oxidoreductase [Candidatus Brocadiia bacterium]
MENYGNLPRRDFIRTSAAVSLGALTSLKSTAFAAGTDKIRVGLIGCGGRGTGAAKDCVTSSEGVEITAMGDLFSDQMDKSLARLSREIDDKVSVTKENSFSGFDAYKKVLASDVDMVILATPPHFRPMQLKAAIEAGKHVFMEKPVAVDPAGVRSVIESSELAKQKGLAIVAGTQRRHQGHYIEVMKRIKEGQIGEIVSAQCFWMDEELWLKKRHPDWSDMEYQCRNWLYYTWLSGDHIVEQHLHNIDVINWAIGSHPVSCAGIGGRQVRIAPEYGNIFDHFTVEFEYPNGVRVLSMCRQTKGCEKRISENIVGSNGSVFTDGKTARIKGPNAFEYQGKSPNPYVQEHADLIASIRAGQPLNEGVQVAESTMAAIMGRMSAYTGRALSWDWVMKSSQLDLTPPSYEMGDLPVGPVAIPGKTKLV